MQKSLILAAVTSVFFMLATVAQATEPLALQGVMKDLGKHMQTTAGAIAYEDWELVAQTAPLLAAHPQPPVLEKARILSYMGSDMSRFKAFDMETHEAAHDLLHAANEKNGVQVIGAFQKVQASCLACHQAFRKPFVEHFYGRQ